MKHLNTHYCRSTLIVLIGLSVFFCPGAKTARAEKTFFGAILEAFGMKQEQPARAAPMQAIAVEANPNMVNQFSPTLIKLLNAELHFARKVCAPTQKQFDQLHELGEKEIKSIAKLLATKQQHTSDWPDSRKLLTTALGKKIDEIFPANIAKKYHQETAARETWKKEAAAGLMVSLVDHEISLNDSQAEKLNAAILDDWDPEWGYNLQTFTYPQYAPFPSREMIEPLLNAKQKELWTEPPHHGRIHFGWEADLGFSGWIRGVNLINVTKLTNPKQNEQPAEEAEDAKKEEVQE